MIQIQTSWAELRLSPGRDSLTANTRLVRCILVLNYIVVVRLNSLKFGLTFKGLLASCAPNNLGPKQHWAQKELVPKKYCQNPTLTQLKATLSN